MPIVKICDNEKMNPQLENEKENITKFQELHYEPESNHPRYNEIMNMNVKELRKEIKSLGLEGTGLKRDLQERLLHHNADNGKGTESDEEGDHEPVIHGDRVAVNAGVKSPDIKRMSIDSIKDTQMDFVVDEKSSEIMEIESTPAEKFNAEKSCGPHMSRVQLAVALREGKLAQLKEHKKLSEKSCRKKHITMGVQTFVKNAVRALSPNKRLKERDSTGASNQNKTTCNPLIDNATSKTIVETTALFMSTYSKVDASLAPTTESSAITSEEPAELISLIMNTIPIVESNSMSKSGSSTMLKKPDKSQQLADARKQRLADMRGKSKPLSSTTSTHNKVIIPLQPIKLLNKPTATKTGLDLKKQTLAAKMREKHATLQTQLVLTNQYSEPIARNLQSSMVDIDAVTDIATDKENNSEACPHGLHANSPGAKEEVQEVKVSLTTDTYEISDRDQSESESDSEDDEYKAKKKVRMDLSKITH